MGRNRSFSLLELLLVIVLIGCLLAALISVPNPKYELDEGVTNFHTLLVFIKANAQSTGKPFKLIINNDVLVLWNPNELQNPSIFQSFPALDGLVSSVNSLVDIKSKNSIVWYADGSSDSGKFCITSKNVDDARKIVIKIEENGRIRIK